MAKLKAPLLSFGASGQIAKAIVYFNWKGLNVAREFVVPSNPKTTPQTTQRGYLSDAVDAIHAAQVVAAVPMDSEDITAYALLASTHPTPRTWFNEIVKRWIDQQVDELKMSIFHGCVVTPGDTEIGLNFYCTNQGVNAISAADFWYGTSKTALINSETATIVSGTHFTATLSGLTNGVKYYIQFRPTAHADFVGVRSGIYYARPSA